MKVIPETGEATRRPFSDINELTSTAHQHFKISNEGVVWKNADPLHLALIDQLAYSAVFGDAALAESARWLIRAIAKSRGIFAASIHELYLAAGAGKYECKTAPAINVRGLTYDMAKTIFLAAQRENAGIVIFEIARSELGYTYQRPADFAAAVLAAAVAVGWDGPVFIQGDHFQANAKSYAEDPQAELQRIRDLTAEAIEAGFYNIDIDASTLVDLALPTVRDQQILNAAITAEMTALIRAIEPAGVTVSVGGEIGEVGGRNSTVDDLDAFMAGYRSEMTERSATVGQELAGISKISVQTGTSHGGVVLPDGTIAEVSVDFRTLAELSARAREFGMGGAVQHGASTLPEAAFGHFAAANAIEVHLATLFQNMLYDHPLFPATLKSAIYSHLAEHFPNERKVGQSDAQFYYTTRKRGYGPFKRALWDLPTASRSVILLDMEESYALIMRRLGVAGTRSLVREVVSPVYVLPPLPTALA